ncbi:uncharacterized protein LY79DRAFT_528090 [Colletotrichum navitas]|uniref:Uncharacterized protein n=1 Tax=Colletotrichum navitas TaxID=681940 RepID=A0AAD8PM55_9PEZI|nr:uncharacterized protein LY79DRAFT_528090 [Colletotrichum navitas]KAK1569772.1 hypothetical protein LY79DRAFT_528090 [Colletotrichum navitas]
MTPLIPDEIWIAILSYLPDFNCLRNTALVSLIHLRCAPSACRQVLLNEVGHRTLSDAIAALESSKFDPRDLNLVANFSDEYLKRRAPIPPKISLADGAALSELHKCVGHLGSKFQDLALQSLVQEQRGLANYMHNWPEVSATIEKPSAAEAARFQRALYRFEVYCNLFKDPEVVRFNLDVVNFQRAHFFDCLSPWEIEQLVAIRDLLAAVVIGPRGVLDASDPASQPGAQRLPHQSEPSAATVLWSQVPLQSVQIAGYAILPAPLEPSAAAALRQLQPSGRDLLLAY